MNNEPTPSKVLKFTAKAAFHILLFFALLIAIEYVRVHGAAIDWYCNNILLK